MLLVVDIGNSNIKYAVFDDDKLTVSANTQTDRNKTADELSVDIYTLLKINHIDIKTVSGAVISSVVPKLTATLKITIETMFHISPMIVGPGIKTGVNILIDDPSQIGSDLVVASVSAINTYSVPAIIISMGTATAIVAIDKNKNLQGVSISPGVNTSLDALTNGSALLPSVGLSAPKHVIGKNTTDSIKSGVVIGEACKIDGMIDKIEKELGGKCTVIATGGLARSIIPNCNHDIIIEENLIINGLKMIFDKNTK